MVSVGTTKEEAWDMLVPLMRGTLENLTQNDPEKALTGPIARGDVETVRKHLRALDPTERELYKSLARATIECAELDSNVRRALEQVLDGS